MTLKFFIVFISSFFASSVILMVLLKKTNSNFSNLGSKTWWTNLLFSLGGAIVTYLSTLFSKDYWITYIILSAVAIIMGTLLVNYTHRRFFKPQAHNRIKQVVSEVLYAVSVLNLMIIGLVAALYFLSSNKFLFFPMLCSLLCFLVPLFLYQSYLNLVAVPVPSYDYWEYPLLERLELDDDDDSAPVLVLGFRIKKRAHESESTFRTKAPADMQLGALLYHFINEYNEAQSETPISFINEQHAPYKWYFSRARKGWRMATVLDPHASIKDNKLREDDIIICDRIETL